MPRVKLSEYSAKKLLYKKLHISYAGLPYNKKAKTSVNELPETNEYVVKVDQGVKGRMKKGLVEVKVPKNSIEKTIEVISKKGFFQYLIEPYIEIKQEDEMYLSIERIRSGIRIFYSKKGGVDIESNLHRSNLKTHILTTSELVKDSWNEKTIETICSTLSLKPKYMLTILNFFQEMHCSFLEINPLVSFDGTPVILDLACQVDSTMLSSGKVLWREKDLCIETKKTAEETTIEILNRKSQASFSFSVLNPNGSVWVLLSGGGASITIADEFHNLGYGDIIGNYGEYSGNPNAEETYVYTKEVINALLKSSAKNCQILIGGGVANFTDIRTTFRGIVRALNEYISELKKKNISVYVRRGGPFQKEGLDGIKQWMNENSIPGIVSGPDMPLPVIVQEMIKKI